MPIRFADRPVERAPFEEGQNLIAEQHREQPVKCRLALALLLFVVLTLALECLACKRRIVRGRDLSFTGRHTTPHKLKAKTSPPLSAGQACYFSVLCGALDRSNR